MEQEAKVIFRYIVACPIGNLHYSETGRKSTCFSRLWNIANDLVTARTKPEFSYREVAEEIESRELDEPNSTEL